MHGLQEIIRMNNGGLSISQGRGGAPAFREGSLREPIQSKAAKELGEFALMMRGLGITERYNRNYSDLMEILSRIQPESMGPEERGRVKSALHDVMREFPEGARLYANTPRTNPGFCTEQENIKTPVRPTMDGIMARLS